jgi:late competence protein required for DNA uptake (superfamily II DNA/RNA helicase)
MGKKKSAVVSLAKRVSHIAGSHLGMYYTFPLTSISQDEWELHKLSLTFSPSSAYSARNPFVKPPEPIRMWGQRDGFCIVPGPYGIDWFGEPDEDLQCEGVLLSQEVQWNPTMKLWGPNDSFDQEKLISAIRGHWLKQIVPRGLIFEAPTSAGKTIVAARIIKDCGVKTLVIVPGVTVFTQWPSRLQSALPGVRVGIMKGKNKCQYENVDVVVAMLKSLVVCDYPSKAFDDFGLVIFDEVHTVPARTYSKALSVVGKIRRKIGCTATFNRNDKMHTLLEQSIGPVIYRADSATEASKKTTLRPIHYYGGIQQILRTSNGDYNYVGMLNGLVEDQYRTRRMVEELAKLFTEGRKVVVIADRVDFLGELHKEMQIRFPKLNLFHYTCTTKKRKREEVDQLVHDGIFASYGLFGLGSDITYLDTIFLATGRSSVEQPVGRLRALCTFSVRKDLLIVDWVDAFALFQSQFENSRMKIYRKKKFILGAPLVIQATSEEISQRQGSTSPTLQGFVRQETAPSEDHDVGFEDLVNLKCE